MLHRNTIFIFFIMFVATFSLSAQEIHAVEHEPPSEIEYHTGNPNSDYLDCDFFSFKHPESSCHPDLAQIWRTNAVNSDLSPSTFQQSLPNIVQPILFVPKNLHYDNSYLEAIDQSIPIVASWYAGQLAGTMFSYTRTQAVVGSKNLKEYCPSSISDTQCIKTIGDGQANGQGEALWRVIDDLAQQGYAVRPGVIYMIFWVGGYGRAVGAQYSPNSGFALVADWTLDGILGKYDSGTATGGCYDSDVLVLCNKNVQLGTIAHELGHVFGLPHPTDDGTTSDLPEYWWRSVMQGFWEFPTSIFLDNSINPEKATLLAHPFFHAKNTSNKIVPIFFIPRGQSFDPENFTQVELSFEKIQQWYSDQLNGHVFKFISPHILAGRYPLIHYCSYSISPNQCIESTGYSGLGIDNENIMLAEMQAQGYGIQEQTIYVIFWVGAYGYAAGHQVSSSSGYVILGDWALDGLAGKYEAGTATGRCSDSPYAQYFCNRNAQLGTLGHTIGMSFGLQQSEDDGTTADAPDYWRTSIMYAFWEYPNVQLLNSVINPEKNRLLDHPFFTPTYTIYIPMISSP